MEVKQTWCLMSTETIRLISDGEKGGGGMEVMMMMMMMM